MQCILPRAFHPQCRHLIWRRDSYPAKAFLWANRPGSKSRITLQLSQLHPYQPLWKGVQEAELGQSGQPLETSSDCSSLVLDCLMNSLLPELFPGPAGTNADARVGPPPSPLPLSPAASASQHLEVVGNDVITSPQATSGSPTSGHTVSGEDKCAHKS